MKHILKYTMVITLLFACLITKSNSPDNSWLAINTSDLPLHSKETLLDYCVSKEYCYALIRDGKSSDIYGNFFGNNFVVFQQKKNAATDEWNRIYENDFTKIMPWKIRAEDLDGDQNPEIILGVYKATHFDPEFKNRLFVFNFDGEKLTRKWTGSQIAGEWDDFYILDFLEIPGEEIVFRSQNMEGHDYLLIYYWFDFGFKLLASSDSVENIIDVTKVGENRLQVKTRIKGRVSVQEMCVLKEKLVEYDK